MTTQFDIGIDWNRDGFICWDAEPGDALNLIPTPIAFGRLEYSKSGSSPTITLVEDTTAYGLKRFRVETGTDTDGGIRFGQNGGSSDNIAVDESTTYVVKLWARGIAGFSGVDMILEVRDQSGNLIDSENSLALASDWGAYELQFTTGAGDTHIRIDFRKDTDATDIDYDVTGLMLVESSTAPDGFNTGDSSDLYENVTDRTIKADWFLGMKRPYQDIADNSTLWLTLDNSDKYYSPEYGSSPLDGKVAPFRPIVIRSNDGTTERNHWAGWIESIRPDVNQHCTRTIEIKAAGPGKFFQNVETAIELQENKRTDEILAALLPEVVIPPPLTRTMLLSVAGYGEVGETAYLADTVIENDLDTGKTTLAYAADNWVRRGGSTDDEADTFNVYRAVRDTVAAERGRFLFDREGQAIFWNRHNLLLKQTVQATFDDTMTGLKYEYAGLDEFKNEVAVTCHPRTISDSDDELLWSLDEPVTIYPEKTRKIGAGYRDESDNRIGGKDVELSNVDYSEGEATIIFEARANRATLEVTNHSQTDNAVLESAEVRGKKITDFGRMEAEARDGESIAFYGQRSLGLNLPSIDNLDFAQTIADFELVRRKQPGGKVKSLTLLSHGAEGGGQHAQQLARTLGDLIRVKESQTAHDNTYFIIGEVHKLSNGGTRYETTWYLESATDGNWFIVGTSKPDGMAALAY